MGKVLATGALFSEAGRYLETFAQPMILLDNEKGETQSLKYIEHSEKENST